MVEWPLELADDRCSELHVATYTREADAPELIAWVRGFASNVAVPGRLTVVSDGSLSRETLGLVETLVGRLPGCRLQIRGPFSGDVHPAIAPLVRAQARGEPSVALLTKLELVTSLRAPAIYSDVDVLMRSGARWLVQESHAEGPPISYNAQVFAAYDRRIVDTREVTALPADVNSGLLVVRGSLDWTGPLSRLRRIKVPSYFTEQATVALGVLWNGGGPLNPHRAVVVNGRDLPEGLGRMSDPVAVAQHWTSRSRFGFWLQLLAQEPRLPQEPTQAEVGELVAAAELRAAESPAETLSVDRAHVAGLTQLLDPWLRDRIRVGAVIHDRTSAHLYVCAPIECEDGWWRIDERGARFATPLEHVLSAVPTLQDDVLRVMEHEIHAVPKGKLAPHHRALLREVEARRARSEALEKTEFGPLGRRGTT